MALDPSYFFYSDGTITLTNGSDIATGDMVAWDVAVLPFDLIFPNDGVDGMSVIKEVLSVNQIRLAKPWTAPTLTDVPYFVLRWVKHTDPKVYAVRVADYLTRLKAIPDNLEEVAGQINQDREAVDAALAALQLIEQAVDADRQSVDTAAGQVEQARQEVNGNAALAAAWAQAPKDTDVNGPGTRSALHYAAKAQDILDQVQAGSVPDNAVSTEKIQDRAVTNAKLADMAAGTVKMRRPGAGDGPPVDVPIADLKTDLGGVLHGQCRLEYISPTEIRLMPYNGNRIIIEGIERQIPASGVSYAAPSMTVGQFYYVYAYWTGSNIALVHRVSAAIPGIDASGIVIEQGAPTRILVGMISSAGSNQFSEHLVRSWFNDPGFQATGATLGVNTSVTSTGPAEVSTSPRVVTLLWKGEVATASANTMALSNAAGNLVYGYVSWIDASGTADSGFQIMATSAVANYWMNLSVAAGVRATATGLWIFTLSGRTSGGTATYHNTCRLSVTSTGIN